MAEQRLHRRGGGGVITRERGVITRERRWRSSGACTRVGASGGAPSARTSALAARLNLAPSMWPSMAAVVGAPRTWREMPARCLAT